MKKRKIKRLNDNYEWPCSLDGQEAGSQTNTNYSVITRPNEFIETET